MRVGNYVSSQETETTFSCVSQVNGYKGQKVETESEYFEVGKVTLKFIEVCPVVY